MSVALCVKAEKPVVTLQYPDFSEKSRKKLENQSGGVAESIMLRSIADRSLTTHNKLGQFGLDAAIGTVPSHLSCSHSLLSLGHALKKKWYWNASL